MNKNDTVTTLVDSSGFVFFSSGEVGSAHALSHQLLDEGRLEEGFRLLGAFLDQHDGSGSQWVHIHWHMAVFEIAVGQIESAHARFQQRILPFVASGEALTDAPSLLWRLWLAGGPSLELEWGPVRDVAIKKLGQGDDLYVELHHLLALAGARDVVGIDRWLDAQYDNVSCCERRLLLQMAWALRTFANRDFEPSAKLLDTIRTVSTLGGSRAQNELFGAIRDEAIRGDVRHGTVRAA